MEYRLKCTTWNHRTYSLYVFDTGFSNIILDLSPQARETKTKINKWEYIKLRSFCTTKETINKLKRQPTEWEKIFINNMSNKGLIRLNYKQNSHNSTLRKTIIKKWAENLNRHFPKEDIQIVNRHMNRHH